MRTYLAGPINGRSDADANNWRDYVISHISGQTCNPMDRDYRGRELEPGIAAEIVELDKLDIDGCENLIVYYDQPSVGTSMEILYAWQNKKYIIIVDHSEKPLSPWLIYHSHARVKTLDEAIELIAEQRTLTF